MSRRSQVEGEIQVRHASQSGSATQDNGASQLFREIQVARA
jgi:hypothetical protein